MPQIIKQGAGASNAFVILPGKQVTLWATGLAGDDYIEIEVVTLSRAPDFIGDSCCAAPTPDIQVTSFVPLMCSADISRQLTALAPYVILDGPQLVTLRAVVHADPGALVEVFLEETDSDGSAEQWRCSDDACTDDTWSPSGNERCVGTDVESEEVSNCGTIRWVLKGPQTWTPTGLERCTDTMVELEEKNDCGTTRWVEDRPLSWVATGDTRCENNLVENKEINDCGKTRWTATTVACGFCASYPVPMDKCDGQAAFGFREDDARDPLATVKITDCDGNDAVYFYPSAGPGHSVPVKECDGTIIGYGANTSECATGVPSRIEIGALPPIKIDALPKLEIGKIPTLSIGELPVVEIKRHVVSALQVGNEVWTVWSDGTKQVEVLPTVTPAVVYCASMRLNGGGYGYHENDMRDPAATVVIQPCAGDTSVDKIYIYPTAAPGRTARQADCDGNLIGYGVNKSDCAADCGCPETVVNVAAPKVTNNFAPTTNVAAPDVTITQAGPSLVAHALSEDGVLTSTLSNGSTVVSNPLPSC